jgi:hypothetical protein
MVNRGQSIAAECVARGVVMLPNVSADSGFVSAHGASSPPMSLGKNGSFRKAASAV